MPCGRPLSSLFLTVLLLLALALPAAAAPIDQPAGQTRPSPAPAQPAGSRAPAAAPAALPAAAQAAALAAKVQARYQQVQGLAADYKRKSIFVASGQDVERTVEGSGRLWWGRPLSLRLEQDEPRNELIVAQAGHVWWVRADRGRADLYPLDRFTTGLRALLDALGGLARVDEGFVVDPPAPGEALEGEEAQTLVLKPKESRADIKRLVLWFDDKDLLLKGFKIISLIGDVTEYRFTQVQANPKLAGDTFSYEPPADYKTTDHRPQPTGGGGGREQ